MRIDEARQNRGLGQVNDGRTRRSLRARSVGHAFNVVAANDDDLIAARRACLSIDQSAGTNHDNLRCRRTGLLRGCVRG